MDYVLKHWQYNFFLFYHTDSKSNCYIIFLNFFVSFFWYVVYALIFINIYQYLFITNLIFVILCGTSLFLPNQENPCMIHHFKNLFHEIYKCTQSNMKSLPLIDVSNPIWYLEISNWKKIFYYFIYFVINHYFYITTF